MNDWKELQIDNLPPDILTGDYVFEYKLDHLEWDTSDVGKVTMLNNLLHPEYNLKYRYRKPEPKMTTEGKMQFLGEQISKIGMTAQEYIDNFKPEPKQPTH